MTKTPTTWPEGQMPTAVQWLDWLLANDRGDQLEIAERVMRQADVAQYCFTQGHEDLRLHVRFLEQQLFEAQTERPLVEALTQARRYRLAWLAARRWRTNFRRVVAEWEADHPEVPC